jgi:hypothetical protein
LSPRRNFKTTGRWHKKKGEQNKAGINLKNRTLACKQYPQQLCTTRPAGREIDRSSYPQGVEKQTLSGKPTIVQTRQELKEGNHENK